MTFGRFDSLRTRLLLIVLLTLLPGLILAVYDGVRVRREAVRHAESSALMTARRLSAEHGRNIEGARVLLETLSHLPEVARMDVDACNALLADILRKSPRYANFGLTTKAGDVVACAVPFSSPVNVGDRLYFREAVAKRAFAVGEYQIGRISGRMSLNVAEPIFDGSGEVRGVIFAALDLRWIGSHAAVADEAPGTVFFVVDPNDVVLYRWPDSDAWMGRKVAGTPVVRAFRAAGTEGTVRGEFLDGVPRLFGFAPLAGAGGGILAVVGIPESEAFAEGDRDVLLHLSGFVLAAVLGLVPMWWIARRLILRRVETFIGAARRLASGDRTARSGLSGRDELGRFGGAFDEMAAAIQRKEEEMKAVERRFRDLVESAPAAMYITPIEDPTAASYISPQIEGMLGFTVEEWKADRHFWPKQIHPEDRARVLAEYVDGIHSRGRVEMEYRMLRKDGGVAWVHDIGVVVRDASGKPASVRGFVVDVSARRAAEEKHRASEDRFHRLAEAPFEGISLIVDGVLVDANAQLAEMFGYAPAEIIGKPVEELVAPESRALVREFFAIRGDYLGEHFGLRKDGSRILVEAHHRYIEEGGRTLVIVAVRDVTERRRLEEQYLRSQKMEAVARLAGGVAHDFNNLLTIINGYSDLLLADLPSDAPGRGRLEEIRTAGRRASALTRQLLTFSRHEEVAPTVLDLNAVLENTTRMLRRLIGEDVELAVVHGAAAGSVLADVGHVEQVVMNLAVNACDAMPRGGKLTIETANVDVDDSFARTHPDVAPGPHVMLAVADTGMGMTEDVKSHLFEPFFTTKVAGKGTGLGLATVYGIVQRYGGHIFVYSEPGKGTTFKIYFPLVGAAKAAPAEAARAPAAGGTETVLLVEDEEAIRALARTVLEEGGYRVLEAADPAHALRIGDEHAGDIDLLLTDVVMPRMGGRPLADRLKARRPALRVLFMSGYTSGTMTDEGVLDSGSTFLQKPFGPDDLLRKVREALAG